MGLFSRKIESPDAHGSEIESRSRPWLGVADDALDGGKARRRPRSSSSTRSCTSMTVRADRHRSEN